MKHKPVMLREDFYAYVQYLQDLLGYKSMAKVLHTAVVQQFDPEDFGDEDNTISKEFKRAVTTSKKREFKPYKVDIPPEWSDCN
jgi:hypothetical protein